MRDFRRVLFAPPPGDLDGEALGEEALGEEALGEEALGEEALGEEALGEEALGEEALDEEALGEPFVPRSTFFCNLKSYLRQLGFVSSSCLTAQTK